MTNVEYKTEYLENYPRHFMGMEPEEECKPVEEESHSVPFFPTPRAMPPGWYQHNYYSAGVPGTEYKKKCVYRLKVAFAFNVRLKTLGYWHWLKEEPPNWSGFNSQGKCQEPPPQPPGGGGTPPGGGGG